MLIFLLQKELLTERGSRIQFQCVWRLPTPTSNSWMPAGYLRIHLNSGIIFPELESDSIGEELSSTRSQYCPYCPPPHMPVASPGYYLFLICYKPDVLATPNSGCQSSSGCSLWLGTNQRPRAPSSLVAINLLHQLTELKKTRFTQITNLL